MPTAKNAMPASTALHLDETKSRPATGCTRKTRSGSTPKETKARKVAAAARSGERPD